MDELAEAKKSVVRPTPDSGISAVAQENRETIRAELKSNREQFISRPATDPEFSRGEFFGDQLQLSVTFYRGAVFQTSVSGISGGLVGGQASPEAEAVSDKRERKWLTFFYYLIRVRWDQ